MRRLAVFVLSAFCLTSVNAEEGECAINSQSGNQDVSKSCDVEALLAKIKGASVEYLIRLRRCDV